jgi:hypothetical protein
MSGKAKINISAPQKNQTTGFLPFELAIRAVMAPKIRTIIKSPIISPFLDFLYRKYVHH